MSATARALDAADGVIDGKYYGRPIVQAPSYAAPAYAAPAYPAYAAPYASRYAYGGYGYPYGYGARGYAGAGASAAALDAADGVIDGKFYGRPIVQGGPVPRYAGGYAGTYAAPTYIPPTYGAAYGGSSALALDAADGVIDGKFYGRQIVGGGAGALVPHRGFAPTYGGAAFALDDPYFDGRYYGRGYAAGYGYGGYGGFVPAYGPSYGAAVPAATYGRYRSPYYNTPVYGGYGYAAPYSRTQATAAALDAADGVIDGKYYGRQIVAN